MERMKNADKASGTFSWPENYADYCAALHNGNENVRLMYAVRSWFFALQEKLEQENSELLVTGLCLPETVSLEQDAFSALLARCQRALENILEQPHEKIVRENVMMPVHKVRELDSSGISWLERRPGRTMREKVRNSRSLLAVDRRMSLDTDENRLLKMFVRRCREVALLKLEGLDPVVDTAAEKRFLRAAARMRKVPGMEEVRTWNSPQPNLVLISDRQYRQIWKAWVALNGLDQQTKQDTERLSERIAVILWAQLVVCLRSRFRLPQLPLRFDPDACTLELAAGPGYLQGIDETGEKLKLERTPCRIQIAYRDRTAELCVIERTVTLRLRGGKTPQQKSLRLTVETLLQPVRILWEMMELPDIPERVPEMVKETPEAVINLFAPQPFFYQDMIRQLKSPLFGQELKTEQETLGIPCVGAKAVWMDADSQMFSIESGVRSANPEQLRVLTGALKKNLNVRTLACLVPDDCSEFELHPLRTAMHLVYQGLKELPRSIAAVFSAVSSPDVLRWEKWRKNFKEGDYALVVDLCGMQCSMTILRGIRSGKNWDGLVWERHLRMQKELPDSCQKDMQTLYSSLEKRGVKNPEELARHLGVEGVLTLCGKTALWQNDDSWVMPATANVQLDVTTCVEEFWQEFARKQQIDKKQLHVILLSRRLCCADGMEWMQENQNDLLQGYRYYASCRKRYQEPLWYDYLPRLAIQRLTDSFELVDPARARVEPGRRERMQIEVKDQFILKREKNEYHFGLIQGSGTSGIRYEAVLKHSALPLREDLACKVQLFYTYGAEEAYELFFCPVDPTQAPFRAVKAQWKRQSRVDALQLPCPPFVRTSWQDVQKKKENRKFSVLDDAVWTLRLVAEEDRHARQRQIYTLIKPLEPDDWIEEQINQNDNQTKHPRKYAFVFARAEDGTVQAIDLRDDCFDTPKEVQQQITSISCELSPMEEHEVRSLCIRNRPWRVNDKGRSLRVLENRNGEKRRIDLYESNFVPGTFREDTEWVTFELNYRKGKQDIKYPEQMFYKAQNILPEKMTPDGVDTMPAYQARYARAGKQRSFYTEQRLNLAGLYSVFANGRKLQNPECPEKLREVAEKAIPALIGACRQYTCAMDTLTVHRKTFSALCLLAPSCGDVCYPFLLKQVRDKQNMRSIVSVSSALGAALDDLTVPGQKELLEECLKLYEDVALRILACAVWNSEDFVQNADPQLLLEWLRTAIRLLKAIYLQMEPDAGRNQGHAVQYFEFALGVFRLRGVPGQSTEVLEKLSLNDTDIQTLYECVKAARTQPEKSDLSRTRLRFQKASVARSGDVPNLLYALLKYITGDTDDQIVIVGIEEAMEDEDSA